MKRGISQQEVLSLGRKKRKTQQGSAECLSISVDDDEQQDFVAFEQPKEEQAGVSVIRNRACACPWMTKKTADIRDSLLRFHNEIIQFHGYITPTPGERQTRKLAFLELKKLIENVVAGSEVKQFGSSALALELPDGDIDLTILCEDDELTALGMVYDCLRYDDGYQQLDFRRGKVPIINVHSSRYGYVFDISVNKRDGLKQLLEIQRMQNGLPEFQYLFMTLKCMLKIRGYSETYHGYVGSYLLFCMVFEYLFEKHKGLTSFQRRTLLSQDLIGFLEFYSGTDWSKIEVYVGRGIRRPREFVETARPSYFRFMSPENEKDDIGGRAFKIKQVFYCFRNRLQVIRNKNFRRGESVLKELLNPSLEEFAYPNRSGKK